MTQTQERINRLCIHKLTVDVMIKEGKNLFVVKDTHGNEWEFKTLAELDAFEYSIRKESKRREF